ncbi:lecithin retinol acyltransferase family protein [Gloeothece verrucosa]|uniref:NC domain protein n=1 Tax=Gloeothece verrucosa (strain PCC 7822) TaxID=497965 RepID=E0UD99_GLOV7|nr:lecithin retinol acyltransferase family protein [Gloeothece verrucosa]ADN14090.1 NC domain protein [Gloeothece verrucosa PCC 7822]
MARGDQIYVYRELLNLQGLYEHHGIDCGDDTVIHYRKPSETIERTSLDIFTRGNPTYIRQYAQGFCFIPDIVVQRAQSRLGEQKYNLLFNNCEHFATWCKTGINDSKQIRDFIPIISQLETSNLYEPLKEALGQSDPNNAKRLLNNALGDLKGVWDELQPKYKLSLKEVETWDKVAKEAVKRNRDDLARAALERKLGYKRRATELENQLKQLATMTEDVLTNLLNV